MLLILLPFGQPDAHGFFHGLKTFPDQLKDYQVIWYGDILSRYAKLIRFEDVTKKNITLY